MIKKKLEQRLYCIVVKQLSTIQKGVQAGHAIAKFMHEYNDCEDVKQWVEHDQTLVILEANYIDLQVAYDHLTEILLNDKEFRVVRFREPDLNELNTAICFLADERMFDESYTEYDNIRDFLYHEELADGYAIAVVRNAIKEFHLAK